jgi:hypothetical protein
MWCSDCGVRWPRPQPHLSDDPPCGLVPDAGSPLRQVGHHRTLASVPAMGSPGTKRWVWRGVLGAGLRPGVMRRISATEHEPRRFTASSQRSQGVPRSADGNPDNRWNSYRLLRTIDSGAFWKEEIRHCILCVRSTATFRISLPCIVRPVAVFCGWPERAGWSLSPPRGGGRGKSGLRRAGWSVTPTGGDPRESATENIPPGCGNAPRGKGEKVR